jgi:hypothetical protein
MVQILSTYMVQRHSGMHIILAHGRDVSPGFLGTFRQDSGNNVHRVQLRAAKEVENETEVEREMLHLVLYYGSTGWRCAAVESNHI